MSSYATQRRRTRTPWLFAGALLHSLVACGTPVDEQVDVDDTTQGLESNLLGEEPIGYLQQASLSTLGDAPVALENGDLIRVGDSARESLRAHREATAEVEAASDALYGSVTTTEEFVETKDEIMLVAESHFVVSDPVRLRERSPRMSKLRTGLGGFSLEDMTDEQYGRFAAFYRMMLAKPATHPLGAAARISEAALLEAALAGQGDVTLRTVARAPKSGLRRASQNKIMAPTLRNGAYDFSNQHEVSVEAAARFSQVSGLATTMTLPEPEQDPVWQYEGGEATAASQFVNGFLEADSWEWSQTWDFGIGWARLKVGAYYALGIRVPIKVSGTIINSDISSVGGTHDVESEFTTNLEVSVIDADEGFYEKAGVSSNDMQDAEELVFNASAFVNVRVYAGWGAIDINKTIPGDSFFDWGTDFRPPLGDCGTDCGLDVWVPANVTKTNLSILGIVHGEIQAGVKFTGDGTVGLTYESLYGDEEVVSRKGAGAGDLSHELSFSETTERDLDTTLAPLEEFGEKAFGYRLSNVEYDWDVEAIPGVRAGVEVNASPFFTIEEDLELWVGFAKMNLGTVHLDRLEGTRAEHEVMKGNKAWHGLVAHERGDITDEGVTIRDVSSQHTEGSSESSERASIGGHSAHAATSYCFTGDCSDNVPQDLEAYLRTSN